MSGEPSQADISRVIVHALRAAGMEARVAHDPSRIHCSSHFDEWTVHMVVFRHDYDEHDRDG